MKRLLACLFLSIFGTGTTFADGLLLQVTPAASSVAASPFDMTLQLRNDSAQSELVFFWQAALQFEPAPGAQGSLSIAGLELPEGHFFAGRSPFGPLLLHQPGGWAVANEGDLTFAGVSLAPDEVGNLTTLKVEPSVDASGTFYLQMALGDPSNPGGSSHWFDEQGPIPIPFGNNDVVSGFQGHRLAAVHVVPEPQTMVLTISLLTGLLAACRRAR